MTNIKPETILIDSWERLIRENSKEKITTRYFPYPKKSIENHKLAVALFKYVFSILKWTPHDVMNFLSKEVIEKLKLDCVYNQLLFPNEVNSRSNPGYVAKLCYPDSLPELDIENIWLMSYQKVLSGGNFKKDFFIDENRYKKARLFLNWYLTTHVKDEFKDIESTYAFFGSDKGKSYLKAIKLYGVCEQLYESPLEYFHMSLPNDHDEYSQDEDLYAITDFRRKKNSK